MVIRLSLILLFTQLSILLNGQDNFFRRYGATEGLNNQFLYSLTQDRAGYLWIGTAEGLYSFNGFEFKHYTDQDSMAENFITTIYKDFSGGLWIGHMSGGITHVINNRFDILIGTSTNNSPITSITESDTGVIWFSTQNEGLLVLYPDKDLTQVSFKAANELIFNVRHILGDLFLVGTQENLYITEYLKEAGSLSVKARIKEYPYSKVVDIMKDEKGEYLIFSQDEGIFSLNIDQNTLDYKFEEISRNTDEQFDNIQGALRVGVNEFWVYMMGNGIVKFIRGNVSAGYLPSGNISMSNGLISNNIKSMFKDIEGNIWLGMYGEGLLRLVDNNLVFYSYLNTIGSNRIYSLSADSNNIWLSSDNSVNLISSEGGLFRNSYRFPFSLTGARLNTVFSSEEGLIYLGFEKEGVYTFNADNEEFKKIFLSEDDLENSINHITGEGHTIWISTKKGICKLDKLTGTKKWFNTNSGLPYNSIQQIFIDSQERAVIATICNNIFYIDSANRVRTLPGSASMGINSVISVAEDINGSIWAATQGNGVYIIKNDGILNLTRSAGLLSDYCYGIGFDRSKNILVSHRGGFSQIDIDNNRIKTFTRLEGIKGSSDFYSNAVIVDSKNDIWFGSSEGLIKYQPRTTSKGQTPPILHVDAVYINKQKVRFDKPIILRPGFYEIEIHYIGINFSNPEMVQYQTILEGYSLEWSALTKSMAVTYEKVGHGEYTFILKGFNENGIPTVKPETVSIRIKKPVYLSPWFYFLIISIVAVSLYQFIRIREKNLRTTQEKLIKNLDEKTKEIIVKEEIIKERKKVEKVLIEAKEKAELSDKLKSSFLTNMSHEIRTPMNAIVGLSELLKMKGYTEAERTEFVDMILTNSNSLLNLIDDILDISKIESNQLKINYTECLVHPLMNDLYKRFKEELKTREKSHVEFRLSLGDVGEDLTIQTDCIRLKQVLGKLMDNAVKYTDSGHIILGCEKGSDDILFFVEDTGIGLTEDKKEIIFELFRKVEENKLRLYRGTGLGLSLSQNLVKLMKSEINVDSEAGKGSRFYFSLPLQESAIKTSFDFIESGTVNLKQNWSGKNILIVEDDISNFMLLREIFKPTGANVTSCKDGFEVVEKMSAGMKPDVIIMDIKLPGIDGYEATRRIRAMDKDIPIIANTAYAMEGDREKSIEAGCNEYVSKPTDKKLLFEILSRYLG